MIDENNQVMKFLNVSSSIRIFMKLTKIRDIEKYHLKINEELPATIYFHLMRLVYRVNCSVCYNAELLCKY